MRDEQDSRFTAVLRQSISKGNVCEHAEFDLNGRYRSKLFRFFELRALYAFTLPLAALLYAGMTLDSALRHAFGVRSSWKGRAYTAAKA